MPNALVALDDLAQPLTSRRMGINTQKIRWEDAYGP